jgi:hypothetical protein
VQQRQSTKSQEELPAEQKREKKQESVSLEKLTKERAENPESNVVDEAVESAGQKESAESKTQTLTLLTNRLGLLEEVDLVFKKTICRNYAL